MGALKFHVIIAFLACLFACNNREPSFTTWEVTGGSRMNNRYSDLAQIDTTNVRQLQVAWVYHTERKDSSRFGPMECNPVIVNGVLYGVSPKLKLFAVDAATGEEKWSFDPADTMMNKTWHRNSVNMNRGVAYWEEGTDKRIIYTVGPIVFAVNAITGKLVSSFGKDGGIDLRYELGRDKPEEMFIAPTSPVMVYKNLFFVSGLVGENTPGHIMAFDVKSGKQQWIFHTIPYPGEPGYETWDDKNAYRVMGSTNGWAGFSLDEKRGILFAVTGNPSNDFYGGARIGAGLYGNCIIAFDAVSGKKIWHYQLVHHDVWDRDLPTPPALITIERNGRKIDAVAQTTKQGFLFVFERATGTPVFPIAEMPFPTNTTLTGEKLWATQPVPALPKPFTRQSVTEADLNHLVGDTEYLELKTRFKSLHAGTPFTPPAVEGTLVFPGYDGGGEWGGPAFDPTSGILYVNANEMAWVLNMVKNKITLPVSTTNMEAGQTIYRRYCMGCHGPDRKGGGDYPSIIGVEKKYNKNKFLELVVAGRRMMPGFNQLSKAEKDALASFILNLQQDRKAVYKGSEKEEAPKTDLYGFTGYNKFLTKEGYPGIKPPWGTLSAINLNTGQFEWQIPFGEFKELTAKGIPVTGRENYGGPVVTAGGLIFIGATADGKFRAINKRNGQILWETDLPAPGVATPAVYMLHGKQYVVIACGGSKWGGQHSDAYIAFALPSH
ncbi:outer membrane protein assembly factor BamB family protein [Chitinophaga sp. 22321]|uniref:PQQ-binding-like beta-propeller repeat protein n=1 Tax=Chitinophaga hostae TaxID=2831022 RepID=A0ABS5J0H1_9BACT|nr:PQQ-binding-like beta-propeller repeat protein [Chitinophaga hostae]MBS0028733.1 PQQ-binding-like beta-propeller repeat protein [Chitinophaga hostae]